MKIGAPRRGTKSTLIKYLRLSPQRACARNGSTSDQRLIVSIPVADDIPLHAVWLLYVIALKAASNFDPSPPAKASIITPVLAE